MKEIEKLNEAFKVFSLASESLQKYYSTLQAEVKRLNNQLQAKNQELKETLEMLRSVMNCIKDALYVLSVDGTVLMKNRVAEELGDLFSPERFTNTELDGQEIVLERGEERRIYLLSVADVRSDKTTTGYVIMLKDITEKRKEEAIRERNKRLIAMGEMMAALVHEMRNPLCSIELYASMLQKELENTELESLSKGALTGVQSLNNILTNMLYFAKPRTPKKERVRVGEFIDEALELLRPVAESRDILVKKKVDESTLEIDSSLIKQVLMNLFLNAVQAMKEGGTLSIRTEIDRRGYLIHIEDTGCGMDEETVERIFDPFFTTRDDGTGLGLSISLKIMQSHQGSINVKSQPGAGTVFTLVFPEELIVGEKERQGGLRYALS
ncbi:MAG: hypothetical protein D6710_09280 [Nitrospirae bacterium]|nr:MAG: hypothetical protein D6710_09280 [Nitrospirota bacterium]